MDLEADVGKRKRVGEVEGVRRMENQANAEANQAAISRNQLILERRFHSGIKWFYWIASLAIISTIVFLSGYKLAFIIGLAATRLIDVNLAPASTPIRVAGVVVDLIISGLFILFGFLGLKKYRWWIVTGMVLYTLDGVVLALLQDWLGVAFHVWALISIWGGLKALGQLQALDSSATGAVSTSP